MGKVGSIRDLTFPGLCACNQNRGWRPLGCREQNRSSQAVKRLRKQHIRTVSFNPVRMRLTICAGLVSGKKARIQGVDAIAVLLIVNSRNGPERRQAKESLHVFRRLQGVVEVLLQESPTDSDAKTDEDGHRQI